MGTEISGSSALAAPLAAGRSLTGTPERPAPDRLLAAGPRRARASRQPIGPRSAADLIPELASNSGPHGWTPGRRRWWRVDCRDVGNRTCFLTVIADRGSVVLVGPPGETAVLSAPQLDQLRTTLRQAADQAGR